MKPILRWAGSKRKLLDELSASVPKKFNTYIEPFVGSACLFFQLKPTKAILADINPALIDFYRVTSLRPNKVLKSAIHYPRSEAGYYSIRERYLDSEESTCRASSFLYLNHFCFNGIFRTNTKGEFNVPFGTRTGSFPTFSVFREASRLLKRARLMCADFDKVLQLAKAGDFVYMDPPYVYKSRKDRGEYGPASFSLCDIPRLRNAIDRLERKRVRFLLSYLDCDEIKPISRKFNCRTVPVSRTVAGLCEARQVVNELLISNY
jgi:DNA adenine methylase